MILSTMKKCPKCGNEVFYVKQKISGICKFYFTNTKKEVDNSTLHDEINYTNIGKYAYCSNCNKRLFKVQE